MNPQDTQAPVATNPQQQVVERLRTAVNVLVTVSNNPSVDQLAGAIGFTLLLNKLGKHATTVFSGAVPSTIEFLKPDETIEKNTDSLRDFIVSLDKSKADKLRYKVEQNVVKIFITPYHTSITQKDLEFSQGDFNVDAVVALGISEREQLDQAITAHGRILHDATVITISAGSKSSTLGAINWHDVGAASLCEMLVAVGDALQPNLIDTQEATAFLTGIVAQTDRFSNEKTSPKIMSLASTLMAAGANQQLIATQLEKATEVPLKPASVVPKASPEPKRENKDGSLTIEHDAADERAIKEEHKKKEELEEEPEMLPIAVDEPALSPAPSPSNQIAIDEHGNMSTPPAEESQKIMPRHRLVEPPKQQEESAVEEDEASGQPFNIGATSDSATTLSSDPLADSSLTTPKTTLSHSSPDFNKAPEVKPSPEIFTPAPSASVLPPAPTFVATPEPLTPPPAPVAPISAPEPIVTPSVPESAVAPSLEAMTLPPAMDDNTLHELEKNLDSPKFVKDPTTTLNEIEEFVESSHLNAPETEMTITPTPQGVDAARDAVSSAISAAPYDSSRPEPLQKLNSSLLSSTSLPAPEQSAQVISPFPGAPSTQPEMTSDPLGQSPPPVPPPMVPLQ